MNNMDKTTKGATAENDVAKPGLWLSPDGIQPLPRAEPSQEAVDAVTTKGTARVPTAGAIPLKAARGDDDLMSKPPVAAPPSGKSGGR